MALMNDRFTVLAHPFRLFFLSSVIMAAVLIPLWIYLLTNGLSAQLALPPLIWHQHEMLAAFLYPAIAGFLLTAVCNWTGTPPPARSHLLMLWLVWLAGRLAMGFGQDFEVMAAIVDLAFMPMVACFFGLKVWRAKQKRQLILVCGICLFWLLDLGFHITDQVRFFHAQILLAGALILVVGGRITPAFTNNWLRQNAPHVPQIASHERLDRIGLIMAVSLVLTQAMFAQLSPLGAVMALGAGVVTLARLWQWRLYWVRHESLLWVLQLGQLWVAIGYLLFACTALGWLPANVWLHALGAGAMGTMILGVMTRVCMGHTGRPLKLPSGGVWIYILVTAAVLVRLAAALNWIALPLGWWLAAVLWSLAFGLFLLRYSCILLAPRPDGKAG